MDFTVKKRDPLELRRYAKRDTDIAYEFTKKVHKEFGTFLRCVVLFGSVTEQKPEELSIKHEGDIDILMIVDDVTYYLSPEVVETYRIVVERTIAETSRRLHVTTLKFTSFWEYTRIGDPIGINMLRNGVALLDTGFFYPLQLLLHQGRIRPTPEAVNAYYSRAPTTLFNSRWHVLQGTLDLLYQTEKGDWIILDYKTTDMEGHEQSELLPPCGGGQRRGGDSSHPHPGFPPSRGKELVWNFLTHHNYAGKRIRKIHCADAL